MRLPKRLAGVALFLVLLAVAGLSVTAFTAPSPSFYGTARAPHSDALTSWLSGTLGFYFDGVSHNALVVRPWIPVMFSSILTLTGSVGAMPLVFAGLYAAALLAVFPLLGGRGRLALTLLAGLLLATRDRLIAPLWPDTLNTDFPAFALTTTGLLLTLVPLDSAPAEPVGGRREDGVAPPVLAMMLAGWLFLGFAAAIRGPALLFGPALLALTLLRVRIGWGAWRPALTAAGLAGVAFALPLLGDGMLRAAVGSVSQGLVALYAFYTDPSHNLTNEAYFRFVAEQPGPTEVLQTYIAFLLSAEGRSAVLGIALERIGFDGDFLLATGFPALLAGSWLAGAALDAADPERGPRRALLDPAKLALLALALAAMIGAPGLSPAGVVLGLTAVTLLGGTARGWTVPAGFALVYLLGTLFVVLTGGKLLNRVVHSYVLALYAGPLWILLGDAPRAWTAGRQRLAGAVAGAAGLAVLTLCAAGFLVPTAMKTLYRSEVAGRKAAIKLTEDTGLDRALYYSGAREILYTRADGVPVGTVRRFSAFENPNGPIGDPDQLDGLRGFNALFNTPGRFID